MTLELAVDCFGIAHVVMSQHTYAVGQLTTECGLITRWQDHTVWWGPSLMARAAKPDDVATCMTCLVVEARR